MKLKLTNYLCYITGWYALVSFGNISVPWVLCYLVVYCFLLNAAKQHHEMLLLFFVSIIGACTDFLLIISRTIIFPGYNHYSPLWHLILWPLYATTINHCLSFLKNKSFGFLVLLGACAGSLAYMGGEKLTHRLIITHKNIWIISVFWGFFLPFSFKLSDWTKRYCNRNKTKNWD